MITRSTSRVDGSAPTRAARTVMSESQLSSDGEVVPTSPTGLLCPFDLSVDRLARFLNAELVDDPTYEALELQFFDDPEQGTGLLAFLQRREDRRVDYYVTPGLRLDRMSYAIGGGTGSWNETGFARHRFEVAADGVVADVRFVDVDGRPIEILVDDRDGRPRRRGTLLAPVGSGIDDPLALMLVHLHGFDLVRRGENDPVIRIGGRRVSPGALPGRRFHGHELIKYAAPLHTIMVNRATAGPVPIVDRQGTTTVRVADDGGGIAALVAGEGDRRVRLAFRPAVPDIATLRDGRTVHGAWRVFAEDVPPLTGGSWTVVRRGDDVTIRFAVTDPWRPGPLPWLPRIVTRVVPVFRRWPTTYRWTARVTLGDHPTMESHWERIGERDDSYRRATDRARNTRTDRLAEGTERDRTERLGSHGRRGSGALRPVRGAVPGDASGR
jgi:hypothetical protein